MEERKDEILENQNIKPKKQKNIVVIGCIRPFTFHETPINLLPSG